MSDCKLVRLFICLFMCNISDIKLLLNLSVLSALYCVYLVSQNETFDISEMTHFKN